MELENKANEVMRRLAKLVPYAEVEISEVVHDPHYAYVVISTDYMTEDGYTVIVGYKKNYEEYFVGLDSAYDSDKDELSILFVETEESAVVPLAVRYLVGE